MTAQEKSLEVLANVNSSETRDGFIALPQIIVLEADEWDRFVEIMTTPREPSAAMVAAAKRHREWAMKPCEDDGR